MQRAINKILREWYRTPGFKPLLLHGAPHVGKTQAVEALAAERCPRGLVRLDCSEEESVQVLKTHANVGGIVGGLHQRMGVRVQPGKHLLFFDNLHAYPEGLRRILELAEFQPGLHIVMAGLMYEPFEQELAAQADSVRSVSVLPLSFAEFLAARKLEEVARTVIEPPERLAPEMHNQLMLELNNYLVVGGLPESVAAYCETKSFEECAAVQKRICTELRALDFGAEAPRRSVDAVLQTCAEKAGERLDYEDFPEELPASQVKHAFDRLGAVQIARRVMPSSAARGVHISRRVRSFKTLLLDIGVLRTLAGMALPEPFSKTTHKLSVSSALCDQFIGQEFLHTQSEALQYWAGSALGSRSQVNYLVRFEGKLCPVVCEQQDMEPVDHALDVYLGSYPGCPRAFIFSSSPYRTPPPSTKIVKIPYYYAQAATLERARVQEEQ